MFSRGNDGVVRLAPDLWEVRTARHYVTDCCHAWHVDEDRCETAVLLTSEVVTNAITHGRSEARLTVDLIRGVIHVEVGDDNSRAPQPAEPVDDALDGRGLQLVDALASAWGVRDEDVGKVVWFDVA